MEKNKDIQQKRKNMIIIAAVGLTLILGISVILHKTRQKAAPPPAPPKIALRDEKEDVAKDAWISQSAQMLQEQQKRIEELEKSLSTTKQSQLNIPVPEPPMPAVTPDISTSTKPQQIQPGIKQGPQQMSQQIPMSVPIPDVTSVPPPEYTTTVPAQQQARQPETSAAKEEQPKVMTNLIVMEFKQTKDTQDKDSIKKDSKDTSVSEGKKEKTVLDYLPDGTYVKAVLLNGVDAPTGQHGLQDPYPAILRIIDYANLPNNFRTDVVSCRLVGEARGSLSSNRVLIKVNTISCVKRDGSVFVKPVTGFVTGEDGKIGVSGIVVTKQGAILARMLIADLLGGFGSALKQSVTNIAVSPTGTVQTVNPEDSLTAALGTGVAQTVNRLAQFYYDMAKEMFPVIEVNAGRKVDVVFINAAASR